MTRKEQVLRWVNRQRVERGSEPLPELPKGKPDSYRCCTLAVALDASVDGDRAILASGECIALPAYVASFIRGFDKGLYPELDLRR